MDAVFKNVLDAGMHYGIQCRGGLVATNYKHTKHPHFVLKSVGGGALWA